jgi:indole-3-glycerol phosphate synthase
LASKRTEVDCAKRRIPAQDLQKRIADMPPPRDFIGALLAAPRPALIAEVKKASPSKGVIRVDFDPVEIARIYAANGAACLSVLTDEEYFEGKLSYLSEIRKTVELPLLRKDFLIDEYQLLESRVAGADAVLFIVAALRERDMEALLDATRALGMEALVEVHDAEELTEALRTSARLIGINNRDLHRFHTTLQTTVDLMPLVPGDRLIVSESGVNHHADVELLANAGVTAVLVGESLMRERDIAAKMHELLGR